MKIEKAHHHHCLNTGPDSGGDASLSLFLSLSKNQIGKEVTERELR